ncbi:MAG: hypothetical protein IJA87_00070 [Clostridia bacterium]|nr:hypothetical protein [Clostridia bacterium]
MGKAKIIKAVVCFVSCIIIMVSLLDLFGIVSIIKPRDNNQPGRIIASYLREDIGKEDYSFSISIYENNIVGVDVCNSKYSTNGFYDIDELESCDYKSKIINWGLQYSEAEDVYASVVPDDCKFVQIDEEIYIPETIKISTDAKEIYFKAVIATIKHSKNHKLVLVDSQNKKHYEPLI